MIVISKLLRLARRYPLVPSMMTYSVLYPSANLVQQIYFRQQPDGGPQVDWAETSRFLIYGGLFHAPLVFNWLRIAARLFPRDTAAHLLGKVAMDQTCFAPVALSSFYIGLSVMEGKDSDGVYKEWREKFPNTWATGICIWTFLQMFNFKFIPPRFRTIYVGVCGFFWFTFLAYLKSSDVTWESPVLKLVRRVQMLVLAVEKD